MKKFLIWVGGIFGTILLIILIYGQISVPYFKFESTIYFDVSQDLLWYVMNDIDNYKNNKKQIVSLEKKEFYGDTVVSWKEKYPFGIEKHYEILRKKNPEILILNIENKFTGMKTKLSFNLSENEKKTTLNIIEESELGNIFWGGLKVLSGRDSFINSEIKWIRVALYNHLINK